MAGQQGVRALPAPVRRNLRQNGVRGACSEIAGILKKPPVRFRPPGQGVAGRPPAPGATPCHHPFRLPPAAYPLPATPRRHLLPLPPSARSWRRSAPFYAEHGPAGSSRPAETDRAAARGARAGPASAPRNEEHSDETLGTRQLGKRQSGDPGLDRDLGPQSGPGPTWGPGPGPPGAIGRGKISPPGLSQGNWESPVSKNLADLRSNLPRYPGSSFHASSPEFRAAFSVEPLDEDQRRRWEMRRRVVLYRPIRLVAEIPKSEFPESPLVAGPSICPKSAAS